LLQDLYLPKGRKLGDQGADAVVAFRTFPQPAFLGVYCRDTEGRDFLITPELSKGNGAPSCDPMQSVALRFATPVLRSVVKDAAKLSPDLAGGRTDFNPWGEENRDYSKLTEPYSTDTYYNIWLPTGLKAAQEYKLYLPAQPTGFLDKVMNKVKGVKPVVLEDEFGRSLATAINMTFKTSHRRPNFELTYSDALLEKGIDSDVPLYVNNLTSSRFNFTALLAGGEKKDSTLRHEIPKVEDVQFAIPMQVREMLGGKSGAVFGSLQSEPIVKNDGYSNRLFAQVTPFQVNVKLGHFSSLAWVTDLATGQPVADADVTVFLSSFTTFADKNKPLAQVKTDKDGLAHFDGMDKLDPEKRYRQTWRDDEVRLFVKVEKDEDVAVLPVRNNYLIDTSSVTDYQVYSSLQMKNKHMMAWGATAQGIYRAGDTIQYKIYVRNQDNNGLIPPPNAEYLIDIVDPMGNSVAAIADIKPDEFGAIDGEYTIPKSAPVGWYNFNLVALFNGQKEIPDPNDEGNSNGFTLTPLRVLVSDFTPAPFKVSSDINGSLFKAGDNFEVSTLAQLHSGGAYGEAAIRSTVTLRAGSFHSDNKLAEGFWFDSFKGEQAETELVQKTDMLDDKGTWNMKLAIPDTPIVYGTLQAESAVQDERGKSVAAVANAAYVGVDRLVGLKSSQWVYESGKEARIDTIVVDEKGFPQASIPVQADIEYEDVVTAKVKGAGNAYLSDVTATWKKVGECKLESKNDSVLPCLFTPTRAGSYRVTARIKDTKGHDHQTQTGLWVSGSDYVQWNDQNADYTLPVIPEKKDWNVGDTARFLVKNPYPDAKALVSVERYGVLDSFVTTLKGSTPIIEISVKPDYLPGFYVSVVVVSPRVAGEVPPMGQVDMGKPGYRMGYAIANVKDPYKEINVTVTPQQDVYQPRDKVSVVIKAEPRHPLIRKENMQLAVSVLDDSVFDLIGAGRSAFDPYLGFNHLDELDLQNYSLMAALVGRQKFEKKGANAGGDGGADIGMRNLFKYVSYWNPAVKLDSKGEAEISFDAPDNLTGWRVLAMAVTPTDRMGLGEGTFKVNRPTEVRPAMPNQVREGDKFVAAFSVMNRTDAQRTIEVVVTASGDVGTEIPHEIKTKLTLAPYKRGIVTLPLESAYLPLLREKPEGSIHFNVVAADSIDSDETVHDLPVLKSRTIEVGANYATTTDVKAQETVQVPADIFPDVGDISVQMSASVIGNLEGAFEYIRDYTYPCWEQRLTRATMASHYKSLKPWMSDKLAWSNTDQITQGVLDEASSFQAPNGGMAYFVATDDRADPYLSAYTAMSFRWLKKSGYLVPDDVSTKLNDYLRNFLRQDAAPDFYQAGMTSTVRAVALAALAKTGDVNRDDVLRYRDAVKGMSLFGKAQYMDAALTLGMMEEAKATADKIFAAGNETGGKFMFQETYDDGYVRILGTPLRDNCAILSAFAHYAEFPEGRELIGDKPFKLVRAVTQSRGQRDHWENTQENMFCLNAMTDYTRAYEQVKPGMRVTIKRDATDMGNAVFRDYRDAAVTIESPLSSTDAGKKISVQVAKEGEGRLYYSTRLRFAPKVQPQDVNSGFSLRREYSTKQKDGWKIIPVDANLKRGDVVRVDLFVDIPAARNFVVVNDPLPGALETVNRDLRTASTVDDAASANYDKQGGSWWFKYGDWSEYDASFWSFYHRELRHDSVRFYADYIPAGHYHLSYTAQVVADGTFAALPTKAEEMYDPDVYGLGNAGVLNVVSDQKSAP
jgi:uncharacterized protein YfaS (alpha-2-macroglobulin family)